MRAILPAGDVRGPDTSPSSSVQIGRERFHHFLPSASGHLNTDAIADRVSQGKAGAITRLLNRDGPLSQERLLVTLDKESRSIEAGQFPGMVALGIIIGGDEWPGCRVECLRHFHVIGRQTEVFFSDLPQLGSNEHHGSDAERPGHRKNRQ